jgi:hypothetical protein
LSASLFQCRGTSVKVFSSTAQCMMPRGSHHLFLSEQQLQGSTTTQNMPAGKW